VLVIITKIIRGQDALSEVHTHKGCYVSVEDPTKGGLSPRASFLFQPPQRKIGAH
jgi:hypothetical protein